MPRAAPQAFQAIVLAGLGREDVDQQVAVIGQHPFALGITLDVGGKLAGFMLQAQADFVADGLHLFLVGAGADDEVVGERGDAGEVEYDQVGGFLRFRSADGNQPGWRSGLGGSGFLEIGLGQNRLLPLSYYGLRGKFTADTQRR